MHVVFSLQLAWMFWCIYTWLANKLYIVPAYIEAWAGVVEQNRCVIFSPAVIWHRHCKRTMMRFLSLGTIHMSLHPSSIAAERPFEIGVHREAKRTIYGGQTTCTYGAPPVGCAICSWPRHRSCSSRGRGRESDYNNSAHTGAGPLLSVRSSPLSSDPSIQPSIESLTGTENNCGTVIS